MVASRSRSARESGYLQGASLSVQPRKARPVVWWAGLGAVFVTIYIYTFARYLANLPANVSAGPTRVPWWMSLNIHAQEIFLALLIPIVVWRWLLKPLVRRQKVPWDGLALAALATMMWQDYGMNWFNWFTTYNAVVINRGSWYEHVPFWGAPNPDLVAEAILFDVGYYVGAAVLQIIWFCFLMRWAHRRWPQLGKVGIVTIIFVFAMLFDMATEFVWLRGGLYHYAGAITGPWLLFSGHYYQFPLYEAPLFGGALAALASVRYFRNDRGQSVAERGIDEVHVGAKAKAWIRWLALVGIFNVIWLAYNVALVPFTMHSSPWPEDIQKRSYFVQNICGAKTDRACPGPQVPIARPGSAYLTPSGDASHREDKWNGPPQPQVPFMK